jgi:spore coat protein U-like protein
MTSHRAILKAIPAVLLLFSAGFAAADTQPLVVTATVQNVCKFGAMPALSFNIDPSDATSQAGTVALPYKCTKNFATPSIAPAVGLLTGRTLNGPAAATMTYDLTLGTFTAGNGFGNAATTVDITATVLAAAYQNAVQGAYSETLSLTISP